MGAGGNSIGMAVLGALIGFLVVVLLAIFIVATYKKCVCERVRFYLSLFPTSKVIS